MIKMLTSRSLIPMMLSLTLVSVQAETQSAGEKSHSDVQIAHRQFLVNGEPFLVRGIHYGPWRPGTGPNKDYPYPSLEGIAQDFEAIRRAHANTVLIYEAPPEVLDLAARYGLRVIYAIALDWYTIGGDQQPAISKRVADLVLQVRSKPALLAWLLGNEISGTMLQLRGEAPMENGLRQLYGEVKALDPAHPISHANWPPTRALNLGFFDFVSFNVYPLWPPEVVATGFGPYIERELRPAADKPLLISEFGVNTIEAGEAGQARLLRDSWQGLIRAGAAGGVVFEYADEWWKNYDNPVRETDWWARVPAPDDERRQDRDPEEHYGLVTADRRPKPALAVVAQFFGEEDDHETARQFGAAVLAGLVLAAVLAWLWARRRFKRRQSGARPVSAY
jgi:hypothetical protein